MPVFRVVATTEETATTYLIEAKNQAEVEKAADAIALTRLPIKDSNFKFESSATIHTFDIYDIEEATDADLRLCLP
jgi:hypothetical protein